MLTSRVYIVVASLKVIDENKIYTNFHHNHCILSQSSGINDQLEVTMTGPT